MNKIKDKLRHLRFKLKHNFLSVENVVLMLALVLCLAWTYQSIVAITKNWTLADRLAVERNELALMGVEVEAAELENEYYKSNEYQELQARKLLDKQAQGEKMIILPENSEAAKNKHTEYEVATEERVYSNIEKWVMYLFPNI